MDGPSQILMRRLTVKTGTVRKGLFSRETKRFLDGWSEKDANNEALCRVSRDGVAVEVKDLSDPLRDAKEGDAFFAVFRARFPFSLRIDAGRDADNYQWTFDVEGFEELLRPERFAAAFRGIVTEAKPYSSSMLEKHFGTIPSTIMHDKVVVEVMGVMALSDKDAQDRYVDIQYRLEQSKEVGEKSVSGAIDAAFAGLLGCDGAVKTTVTSFHAKSAEREAAEAKDAADRQKTADRVRAEREAAEARARAEQEAAEARAKKEQEAAEARAKAEAERQAEVKKRQQNAERIAQENDARRAEERKQKQHELELAELEAQKKKLQGGDMESAFAAFETIANVLGDAISNSGAQSFSDILKDARRAEFGLRILALAMDKKRQGGVTLAKNAPSFQSRGFAFTTKKTPALHHGESLSSTITSGRCDGWLTVLNVSERNEVIPLLPNADFPDVRVGRGERILIGDDASDYIPSIFENASSGTDHLIAIVSDSPLIEAPIPPLGAALTTEAVSGLVSTLETLDSAKWATDVISFTILP